MDICQTVENVPRTLRQFGIPTVPWTLVGNAGHECNCGHLPSLNGRNIGMGFDAKLCLHYL